MRPLRKDPNFIYWRTGLPLEAPGARDEIEPVYPAKDPPGLGSSWTLVSETIAGLTVFWLWKAPREIKLRDQ